ncbi:tetratricopeptide repeat protein [Candidatus Saccharibacteria bacterium]|nr:tetratricopeptide repeat protein [Candidatus Saccharibacteria bacterium]
MLGVLIILGFTIYLAFFFHDKKVKKKERKVDPKIDTQMKKLWTIAQDSMKERKPVRAEKALLTILKFDEKNAAAYNRLGILYAKGQKFDDAIECFEIAQSLDNNPSSLHNAGLIYLETGAFEKAAMAFRQALEMEGDVPARFLALAKAEEKLGNRKAAIEALEAAYDLDHTTTTLRQILAIYESTGDTENATATIARIEAQLAANEAAKKKKLARVRKRPLGARKKSV